MLIGSKSQGSRTTPGCPKAVRCTPFFPGAHATQVSHVSPNKKISAKLNLTTMRLSPQLKEEGQRFSVMVDGMSPFTVLSKDVTC